MPSDKVFAMRLFCKMGLVQVSSERPDRLTLAAERITSKPLTTGIECLLIVF